MSELAPSGHRYRIEIVGGPQGGARAPVRDVAPTTLGGALECDVVLSDARVPALALTFVPDAEGLCAEVHAEGVSCDGVALEPGTHRLLAGQAFSLGDVRFVLTDEREADASGTSGPAAEPESPMFAEGEGGKFGAEASGPFTPLAAALFGVTLIGALAIGVSYWAHSASASGDVGSTVTIAEPLETKIPRLLADGGFGDVTYVPGPNVGPRLTGHVASRARLLELQRLARTVSPRPRLDVHVQDEIVQGVEDFYRTHGIAATVEAAGAGTVKVVTRVAGDERLAGLEARAMGDVAGLTSLRVRNEPPPEEPEEAPPAARSALVEDEGKRVVAVVSGDPSYVVTADDSRYFVGSSLPTGHTIEEIDDDSVVLDREGERTRLEF